MHFTNSKQSWYAQRHKGVDYSGWQCETLSLEMNLAAGQETRSRVALCILIHLSESMLKATDFRWDCSQSVSLTLLTCCTTACWPTRALLSGWVPRELVLVLSAQQFLDFLSLFC